MSARSMFAVVVGSAVLSGCMSFAEEEREVREFEYYASAFAFGADVDHEERSTIIDASFIPGYPYTQLRLVEEFSLFCSNGSPDNDLGCYRSNVFHYDPRTGSFSEDGAPEGFSDRDNEIFSLRAACERWTNEGSFLTSWSGDYTTGYFTNYSERGPLLEEKCSNSWIGM